MLTLSELSWSGGGGGRTNKNIRIIETTSHPVLETQPFEIAFEKCNSRPQWRTLGIPREPHNTLSRSASLKTSGLCA